MIKHFGPDSAVTRPSEEKGRAGDWLEVVEQAALGPISQDLVVNVHEDFLRQNSPENSSGSARRRAQLRLSA